MEEEPGDLSTLLGDDLLQQALQEVITTLLMILRYYN